MSRMIRCRTMKVQRRWRSYLSSYGRSPVLRTWKRFCIWSMIDCWLWREAIVAGVVAIVMG